MDLRGQPETIVFSVLDKLMLRKFFFEGVYDRFIDYNRMTALRVNRMQEMVYVNHGNINSTSDMNLLEDSLDSCSYPLIAKVDPKYTYAYYLLAETKLNPLKIRVRDRAIRSSLFLSPEGVFSYKSINKRFYKLPFLNDNG